MLFRSKNVETFELIPWILGRCADVKEARELLSDLNLMGTPFQDTLPAAQLHWILADREEAITVESVKEGLRIYDNPAGVLTNNPPFEQQMFQLNNYMHLSPKDPQNHFSGDLPLSTYCRGMGALGLPGDLSSQSRFVRAAFVKMNAVSGDSESESFFIYWDLWISSGDAAWQMTEHMKGPSTLPAAMRKKGFTITPLMKTIK